MRKTILRWSACAAVLVPAFGASSAMADVTSDLQAAGQLAANHQSANSTATSTQDHPSNQNINVAIMSPGAGSGDVTQSNTSEALSAAGNANGTSQSSAQGSAGGAAQFAEQAAASRQAASSSATSTQKHPANTNIKVAILSPGAGSGDVTQSNSSAAGSKAGNANDTSQRVQQDGGGGAQAAVQKALNDQSAHSSATSTQDHPSNKNVEVAILGHETKGACCDRMADGESTSPSRSVSQSNDSSAGSLAGNENATQQTASQRGGGAPAPKPAAPQPAAPKPAPDACSSTCGGEKIAVQAVGQFAANEQDAQSHATSTQVGAKNLNLPISLPSHGGKDDEQGEKAAPASEGDVTQSNASAALSFAGNANAAKQSAAQQGGSGSGVQAIGQAALNRQSADSHATSTQWHPSNLNLPVSVLGSGGGGSVTQSNESLAASKAGSANWTSQTAAQHGALFERPVPLE